MGGQPKDIICIDQAERDQVVMLSCKRTVNMTFDKAPISILKFPVHESVDILFNHLRMGDVQAARTKLTTSL